MTRYLSSLNLSVSHHVQAQYLLQCCLQPSSLKIITSFILLFHLMLARVYFIFNLLIIFFLQFNHKQVTYLIQCLMSCASSIFFTILSDVSCSSISIFKIIIIPCRRNYYHPLFYYFILCQQIDYFYARSYYNIFYNLIMKKVYIIAVRIMYLYMLALLSHLLSSLNLDISCHICKLYIFNSFI